RDLSLNASGNLELGTGSIGALRNLSFTSLGDLNDLGSINDFRFGSGILSANAGGALNLSGGYWTAPTVSLTAGGSLANAGVISGDTVTVSATDTTNTNTIQAAKELDLTSNTVENSGKNAVIVGSTDSTGTANINASTISNSGTIWSAGDLSLAP